MEGELEVGPSGREKPSKQLGIFSVETLTQRCPVGIWTFKSRVPGSDLGWNDILVDYCCIYIGADCPVRMDELC